MLTSMNLLTDRDQLGERLFSPESMIWRVNREMALLLGGGRALLMQLAHPKVAAGVADHSHFTEDPMGRLLRTMRTMWSIVFDDSPQANDSLERVSNVHRQVQGTIQAGEPISKGTPYRALDPDLLLWVHATLVDSAMLSYELFVKPMSLEKKKQYYEETKELASLFAVPKAIVPSSLEVFNAYMERMLTEGTISVGPTARSLAQEILYPRPWILKMGGPLSFFITVGLLPQPLREAYGLTWNERKEKIFGILTKSIRRLLPLAPGQLRIVPNARAAEKKKARRTWPGT